MSKELEAWQDIKLGYICGQGAINEFALRENEREKFKIIETSLKRLEEHDKIFKKYDIKDIWLEPALFVIKNHFPMNTKIQLKKLKALEIIRIKEIDIAFFKDCPNIEEYNNWCLDKAVLTQEEYDLLKEILL